jgi:probable rRNA maturation factor
MSTLLEFTLQEVSPSNLELPWSSWFINWLEHLELELPVVSKENGYELSLRLTNDAEIQSFNLTYRHLDQATDVLAFASLEVETPQIEENCGDPLYLGDIIISIETAQKQAIEQGHSLTIELAWLASHGFLHLLGWDHPDQKSLESMLNKQYKLLQSVGFSDYGSQEKNRLLLDNFTQE